MESDAPKKSMMNPENFFLKIDHRCGDCDDEKHHTAAWMYCNLIGAKRRLGVCLFAAAR